MNRQESPDFLHARNGLTDAGMDPAVAETVNEVALATVATASDLRLTENRLD